MSGQPLLLQMQAGTFPAGLAFLFVGLDGTHAAGSGFLLPGLGEPLLAPAPEPILLAAQPTALHVGALPAPPVEVSTGLAVRFVL